MSVYTQKTEDSVGLTRCSASSGGALVQWLCGKPEPKSGHALTETTTYTPPRTVDFAILFGRSMLLHSLGYVVIVIMLVS